MTEQLGGAFLDWEAFSSEERSDRIIKWRSRIKAGVKILGASGSGLPVGNFASLAGGCWTAMACSGLTGLRLWEGAGPGKQVPQTGPVLPVVANPGVDKHCISSFGQSRGERHPTLLDSFQLACLRGREV